MIENPFLTFLQKASTDDTLKQHLQDMASSGQAAGEKLIALAKEHGVILTPDNIREGIETMRNRAMALGDDALAKLSGSGLPDVTQLVTSLTTPLSQWFGDTFKR